VPDSARRVASALQWFADHREHQMTEFAVDSSHVKQALKAQKERFIHIVEKRVQDQDPHFQLPTSVLTQKLNTARPITLLCRNMSGRIFTSHGVFAMRHSFECIPFYSSNFRISNLRFAMQ
jgi:hypothetical protein